MSYSVSPIIDQRLGRLAETISVDASVDELGDDELPNGRYMFGTHLEPDQYYDYFLEGSATRSGVSFNIARALARYANDFDPIALTDFLLYIDALISVGESVTGKAEAELLLRTAAEAFKNACSAEPDYEFLDFGDVYEKSLEILNNQASKFKNSTALGQFLQGAKD